MGINAEIKFISINKTITLISFITLIFVNPTFGDEAPVLPSDGLGAAISVKRGGVFQNEDLKLTVSLYNMSKGPIDIDAWPGYWFIEVYDQDQNLIQPRFITRDVLRPMPKATRLFSGERWDTDIVNLRLVAHLPGSTPMWEYDPLGSGVYLLRAVYSNMFGNAQFSQIWTGTVRSLEFTRIEIRK